MRLKGSTLNQYRLVSPERRSGRATKPYKPHGCPANRREWTGQEISDITSLWLSGSSIQTLAKKFKTGHNQIECVLIEAGVKS